MKLSKLVLLIRAIPKAPIFNFHYFPFAEAIRLPVIVSHRVWFAKLGGRVRIAKPSRGGIRIGFNDVGVFDQQRSRSVWEVRGTVNFEGRAELGHGRKICVLSDEHLTLGEDVAITAESNIIAAKQVSTEKTSWCLGMFRSWIRTFMPFAIPPGR